MDIIRSPERYWALVNNRYVFKTAGKKVIEHEKITSGRNRYVTFGRHLL